LAATALLEADRSPDDAAVAQWMNGNLCRCGTYSRIRHAIGQAVGTLASGRDPGQFAAAPELEMQPLTPEELADPVHPYVRIGPDGPSSRTRASSRWARVSTPRWPRSSRRN